MNTLAVFVANDCLACEAILNNIQKLTDEERKFIDIVSYNDVTGFPLILLANSEGNIIKKLNGLRSVQELRELLNYDYSSTGFGIN